MAIVIEELVESKKASKDRAERVYRVTGTGNGYTAKNTVAADTAKCPTSWAGLPRIDLNSEVISALEDDEGTDLDGLVIVTASYARMQGFTPGITTVSWSTKGGTFHLTQSRGSRAYDSGGSAPSLATANKGAINVDPANGEVRGVDVVIPQMNMAFHVDHAPATVDADYIGTLIALTGAVNDDTFQGQAAGQVLFMGASCPGYTSGDQYYPLDYEFALSPNEASLTIGDITGVVKYGWEYLDVRYTAAESGGQMFQQPIAVYVHEILPTSDFDDLVLSEEL